MQNKTKDIDDGGNDDEANNTGNPMAKICLFGHLQITPHVPKILYSIATHDSYSKETDPLDAEYTAQGSTGQTKPCPPLGCKRSTVLLVNKLA